MAMLPFAKRLGKLDRRKVPPKPTEEQWKRMVRIATKWHKERGLVPPDTIYYMPKGKKGIPRKKRKIRI